MAGQPAAARHYHSVKLAVPGGNHNDEDDYDDDDEDDDDDDEDEDNNGNIRGILHVLPGHQGLGLPGPLPAGPGRGGGQRGGGGGRYSVHCTQEKGSWKQVKASLYATLICVVF